MSSLTSKLEAGLKLNSDQLSLLKKLKEWVEKKTEFYGRSDEDFLVPFLRSSEFDLEQSKMSLKLYYEARDKYPQWWTNRNLYNPWIQYLINHRFGYALTDHADGNYPTVFVVHLTRAGPDSSVIDFAGMYINCGLEAVTKRKNCQLNGAVLVLDYNNCYWWMQGKAIWLPLMRDLINSIMVCSPIQIKRVVLVNATGITSVVVNIARLLLPEAQKDKIQCCKSWSDIDQFIPLEVLPVEFGGDAEPIKKHEDAFLKEFLALNEYFMDDNKYGFLSNYNM